MAVWLRLAILSFCVVSILAAANNDEGDDPAPTEPAPTEPAPTEPAPTEPVTVTPEPTVPPAPSCIEGERAGDSTDCRKYSECKGGTWKFHRCFWFFKFDSILKKCVLWGAHCTTESTPPKM